ncbi:prokineticin receptor 2-like [Glandiceps talaboti]
MPGITVNNETNGNLTAALSDIQDDFPSLFERLYDDDFGEGDYLPEVHIAAKIIIAVIFGLIFVVCGFGNTLLCFTIFRLKRLRTVTNLFIASLAISDALVAIVCAPFCLYYYIMQNWIFGRTLCSIVSTVNLVSLHVSVNTLLTIAVERYYVIFHPLTPRLQKRAVVIIIGAIWIISFIVSLPTPMFIEVSDWNDERDGNKIYYCGEYWSDSVAQKAYIVFLMVAEYLIPMLIMTMAYLGIVRKVWFHRSPGDTYSSHRQREMIIDHKKKTIQMLIIVVISFGVCWGPYHGYNIKVNFYRDTLYHGSYNMTLFYVVESIAMFNSLVNTVVYFLMNECYRKEVWVVLTAVFGKRRRIPVASFVTRSSARSTVITRGSRLNKIDRG